MEHMDRGTLSDVISETHMSEEEIAAVSREVKDPTCASFRGRGQDCLGNRGSEQQRLHVPSFVSVLLLLLWRSKSISSELCGSVPALTVLCSCILISCCCILTLSLVFVFAVLHLASLNVCLEPVCTAFPACKSKGAGGRI